MRVIDKLADWMVERGTLLFHAAQYSAHRDGVQKLHPGMRVQTSDGSMLGKVARLWRGSDEAAPHGEEIVVLQVRGRGGFLWVPVGAILTVSAWRVTLSRPVGEMPFEDWSRKPLWISRQESWETGQAGRPERVAATRYTDADAATDHFRATWWT